MTATDYDANYHFLQSNQIDLNHKDQQNTEAVEYLEHTRPSIN